MIGFGWGNGAEGMDILTACKVSEVKREERCILPIEIYNCAYWIIKRSSSKVKEEIRSQRYFVKTETV